MSQPPTVEEVAERLVQDDKFIEKVAHSLAKDDNFTTKFAANLAKDNNFTNKMLTPPFESELAKYLGKEQWMLVMANNEDFVRQTLTPQLKSELARRLSKEKWPWVIRDLVLLAIFSFLGMGVVYWQSLSQGADIVKAFAIGAFCLIILVINVAFSMTASRLTR